MNRHVRSRPRHKLTSLLLALALTSSACAVFSDDGLDTNGSHDTDTTLSGGADDTATSASADNDAAGNDTGDAVGDGGSETGGSTEPVIAGFSPLGEPGVGGRTTSIIFDPGSDTAMLVGGDMLGVAWANDPLEQWNAGTGLLSWEISEFSYNPDVADEVWVGTMGGPYRSSDGGHTWTPARDGMPAPAEDGYSSPIEVVQFDPNDATHLVAFSGSQREWNRFRTDQFTYGAVWESTDDGASWINVGAVGEGANIQDGGFTADGATLMVATRNQGVHTSQDGGRTWTKSSNGLPHDATGDLAIHSTDPNTAWVALKATDAGSIQPGGIYVTRDGGQSWSPQLSGLDVATGASIEATAGFDRIVVSPSNPNRLYTSNVGRGQNAVYRSDDGGESWTTIANRDTDRPRVYQSSIRAHELAVHPTLPDLVVFSQDDYVLMSRDSGETWTDLTTDDLGDNRFSGRGYSGLVSSDIAFDPHTPDRLAIAAFDGGNFIGSNDGGASWNRPNTAAEINWGGAEEIRYASDGTIYVLLGQSTANFRGVGVSTNGGESFDIREGGDAGLPATRSDLDPTGLAVSPNDPNVVFVVVDGVIYRSTNQGETFDIVMSSIDQAFDIDFDADGSNLYITSAVGVFVSTDGGDNAQPLPESPFATTRLTVDSLTGDLYVTQFGADGFGGLNRYDGSSWERLIDDPQVHEVAVAPDDSQILVAVTSDQPRRDVSRASGVMISTDGGATWVVQNTGLPMTRLTTVEFDPFDTDRIVVGTTGRGFFEGSIADLANL